MKIFDLQLSPKARKSKYIAALVALCLVATLSIGGAIAYVITQTNELTNEFEPGKVTCAVEEEAFDGAVKKNVTIKNTGNTDAYIRCVVNILWMKAGDPSDQTVIAKKPVENTDYTISFAEDNGWWLGDDGYWYYSASVAPNGNTPVLITECKLLDSASAPEGYRLSVEIIASAIQSEPTDAVQSKWNVDIKNGDEIAPKETEEADA